MEQLLCYWPEPSAAVLSAVRRAALPLKVRLRTVSPEQSGQTVGFLCGRKGFEAQEGEAPAVPEPIPILDSFTGERMDALLRALARARVPRTVLKAAVTATNVDWTLYALWQELKKEREALERGEEPVHQK